jgi:hypothetical protein
MRIAGISLPDMSRAEAGILFHAGKPDCRGSSLPFLDSVAGVIEQPPEKHHVL